MQEFYWRAVTVLRRLLLWLPHRWAVRLGGWLGLLVWLLCKKRVDAAEARCVRILGLGPTLARRIVRGSYRNMGRSAAEFLRMPKLVKEVDRYLSVQGLEHVEKAARQGRPVIFMLGHLDNWEIANAFMSRRYRLNVIGADQRDPRMTALLMELRSYAGSHNVTKGQGLKAALACLRRGEMLAILMDQDAKEKGLVVPFLGFPASTPLGPAKLAAKFAAAVIPAQVIRNPDGFTHRLIFSAPLEDPSGAVFGSDEALALRACNDLISRWILEHPDQWMLWLYPRWGSTLPGDRG